MKTRTKIKILDWFGALFGCLWILASVVAIYLLYGALANDSSPTNILWAVAAGLVAKLITNALNANKRRLKYLDQLFQRGIAQFDAEEAWRRAEAGGANLLRNLQQAELGDQIDRLESNIGLASMNHSGD